MKKTTLLIFAICLTAVTFAQSNSKLIELGEAYKDYMFRAEPAKSVIKDINKDVPRELKTATAFITQTITTN
jgi:hypothetical protein